MSNTRKRMSSHRCWGSTDNGRIEFESLTTDTLEGALDVIRKSFIVNESVSTAVDILSEPGAGEELVELCVESAKDGVSAVAIDINAKKVVGVAFNKIQVCTPGKSFFEKFTEGCKCQSSKALMEFMIDVDSRINLFKEYNVNSIFEIMFLAVLPEYGQRRIGELLVSTSLQIGTELKQGNDVKVPVTIRGSKEMTNANKVPSLMSAIMTSRYSHKIALKLGFKEVLKVPYEEFEFKGKKFTDRVKPPHVESVLIAKILK